MQESRLFKIMYYLLDKGRATAPELAEKFEVSARTIYRDIDALSGAGIPVYAEQGRGGGISLLDGFVLDRAFLSENERREILSALQSLTVVGSTYDRETLAKLSALFRVRAQDWYEVDFSRWGSPTRDKEKFEMLKSAVIRCREVRISYANSCGVLSERTVWPLKLLYKSKEWYLKAYCTGKQDFRTFKLNRILDMEVLDSGFDPVPYPESGEMAVGGSIAIKLKFPGEMAYRVYDEFDVGQVERQENGELIVSVEMPDDGWIVGSLLSFGTKVEVMEPESLRKLLAERARAVYEKNRD